MVHVFSQTWIAFFFSISKLSAISLSERNDFYASLYSEGLLQFYPTVTRGHSCADKELGSFWKCFYTPVCQYLQNSDERPVIAALEQGVS